jgi:hypothetical protein
LAGEEDGAVAKLRPGLNRFNRTPDNQAEVGRFRRYGADMALR